MTHPQMSRRARHERHKERLRTAARGIPAEDPQLRRMLATHIHCGEPMQLAIVHPALLNERLIGNTENNLTTYRCACGFSFDHIQD